MASSADKVQESTPKLPIGDPDSVLFVAYGVEAHITRALKNEICWTFVSEGRYCRYGMHCLRIHPKDKAKYAEKAMEELRRYGEETHKARAALEELMRKAKPNLKPVESIDPGLKKPAKVGHSDSMVSSTPSSPSTPSLSLSSITTLSSQTSLADSSTATSDFHSVCSSPIRLSPSASKANSSVSSESSPRLVESTLDTPTMNGYGSAKAPRFYGATISGQGPASESCSRSSVGLSGGVCLSTSCRSSPTSTLPPYAKSSNASTSSLQPISPLYPMLQDRVNIPPHHSSQNHVEIPYDALNHIASMRQHQAAQKLTSVSTEPIHDPPHPRQHFRDNPLTMSRNMPHDNYEYRHRSQSTPHSIYLTHCIIINVTIFQIHAL
ncbi:hypothetical protein BJ165DRAFT_271392 [Panaeolus papilionaceus]|nr:hypothetical protein BJ165DRAFT_271392 [Panaeolus papilionaceus]